MKPDEILFAAIFIAATAILICFFLIAKLLHVKNRLHNISDILDDIANGNGNHKILANPKDITATICYKLNKIVCHYEEQLSKQNQSIELNKQLMTSLSHDVRTPLTTLLGYLDAAHKGIVQGNERECYIEAARKKAHELKEYIDNLFEWFKLGSDEETFEVQPHEIAELTRNLLKDWIPIFEEKGLNYEISIPQRRIMAMVDFDAYCRILNNLLQNILAHSDAGRIEITVSYLSKWAEICVADDGIGISKEDLSHIFERLYKCDKARSEKGSGLGLNIVKKLTALMSGTITISSEPNKRTAFTLHFPLDH